MGIIDKFKLKKVTIKLEQLISEKYEQKANIRNPFHIKSMRRLSVEC